MVEGVKMEGSVSIRMYRGLLGDFFLVRHEARGKQFKMLIDCGVLQCIGAAGAKPQTARGKVRIRAGVADLLKDTDKKIDLVVATHEHYDHLSGFILASDQFAEMTIGKVWMAWTEDRGDAMANGYRNKNKKAINALAALTQSAAFAGTDTKKMVDNLLQFYGDPKDIRDEAMAVAKKEKSETKEDGAKLAGNASCEKVLEWLRQKAGAGNVSFLQPGEAVTWGVDGAFRAYVLGPPKSDERLRKLNPSEGKGTTREVYLTSNEDAETMLGLAAEHGEVPDEGQLARQPFARPYERRYGGDAAKITDDKIVKLYEDTKPDKRIDGEWMGSAENLALKIDGDVNNTSLALALEVTEGRILLFPGDAQVGNWLSWGDQTYPADDKKDGPRWKIEDLLARVVFYKVGHHASHNATARARGLELMTDSRLCAMIPVVETVAKEQKTTSVPDGWAMPYDKLSDELKRRTNQRILMGDGEPEAERSSFASSIFGEPRYGALYKDPEHPEEAGDPLWVELSLKLTA